MADYGELSGMARSHRVTQPAKDTQVRMVGGGYGFRTGDWTQMRRWLVLGSDRNAYYATARQMTMDNAKVLLRCLSEDYRRYVDLLVEARSGGIAPKSDTAIFALAVLYTHGSDEAKWYAYDRITKICRTGTDIQQFSVMVAGKVVNGQRTGYMRGWGRAVRSACERWLVDRDLKSLVYQLIKYRARHGTSMKRVIQLSHPKPGSELQSAVFGWAVSGKSEVNFGEHDDTKQLWAFQQAMGILPEGARPTANQRNQLIELISTYKLPWEAIPNQWLKDPDVLEHLLQNMPMIAMVRHISRFSRTGTMDRPHVKETVISRLTSRDFVKAQDIHPMRLFQAYITSGKGRGIRSSWPVDRDVVRALEEGFYLSFDNVVPTNQGILIALDVSGSMWGGGTIFDWCSGMDQVAPIDAAAALSLITMRTEPYYRVVAFADGIKALNLKPDMSIARIIKIARHAGYGGTNMGAAIEYATKNHLPVDLFQVITDNEANRGVHPSVALTQFQQSAGRDAKAAFVAMVSYRDSVADPERDDMMDFVGFDPTTPEMMRRFAVGELSGVQD